MKLLFYILFAIFILNKAVLEAKLRKCYSIEVKHENDPIKCKGKFKKLKRKECEENGKLFNEERCTCIVSGVFDGSSSNLQLDHQIYSYRDENFTPKKKIAATTDFGGSEKIKIEEISSDTLLPEINPQSDTMTQIEHEDGEIFESDQLMNLQTTHAPPPRLSLDFFMNSIFNINPLVINPQPQEEEEEVPLQTDETLNPEVINSDSVKNIEADGMIINESALPIEVAINDNLQAPAEVKLEISDPQSDTENLPNIQNFATILATDEKTKETDDELIELQPEISETKMLDELSENFNIDEISETIPLAIDSDLKTQNDSILISDTSNSENVQTIAAPMDFEFIQQDVLELNQGAIELNPALSEIQSEIIPLLSVDEVSLAQIDPIVADPENYQANLEKSPIIVQSFAMFSADDQMIMSDLSIPAKDETQQQFSENDPLPIADNLETPIEISPLSSDLDIFSDTSPIDENQPEIGVATLQVQPDSDPLIINDETNLQSNTEESPIIQSFAMISAADEMIMSDPSLPAINEAEQQISENALVRVDENIEALIVISPLSSDSALQTDILSDTENQPEMGVESLQVQSDSDPLIINDEINLKSDTDDSPIIQSFAMLSAADEMIMSDPSLPAINEAEHQISENDPLIVDENNEAPIEINSLSSDLTLQTEILSDTPTVENQPEIGVASLQMQSDPLITDETNQSNPENSPIVQSFAILLNDETSTTTADPLPADYPNEDYPSADWYQPFELSNCTQVTKLKLIIECNASQGFFDEISCNCVDPCAFNENSCEDDLNAIFIGETEPLNCTGKEKILAAINCNSLSMMFDEETCQCA